MTSRADVIGFARELLDVPFHHQGFNAHGCDCIGLVRWTYRRMGLGGIDLPAYPRSPDGRSILELARNYGHQIPAEQAGAGDVAVFRFTKYPQHFGILTDVGLIHAYERAGRVVEHTFDAVWRRQMVAAFRLPGVM